MDIDVRLTNQKFYTDDEHIEASSLQNKQLRSSSETTIDFTLHYISISERIIRIQSPKIM